MANLPPNLIVRIQKTTLNILYQGPENKILSLRLIVENGGHQTELARVPYQVTEDQGHTHINYKHALYQIKSVAAVFNAIITNLDEYEPACPDCTNHTIHELHHLMYEIYGIDNSIQHFGCTNCGYIGPAKDFYYGDLNQLQALK